MLIIVFFIFTITKVFSDDGLFWNSLDSEKKLGIVIGYSLACINVDNILIKFNSYIIDGMCSDGSRNIYLLFRSLFEVNLISSEQIVLNIDKYYFNNEPPYLPFEVILHYFCSNDRNLNIYLNM